MDFQFLELSSRCGAQLLGVTRISFFTESNNERERFFNGNIYTLGALVTVDSLVLTN